MLAWIDAYKLSTKDVTLHIDYQYISKIIFLYFCRHQGCRIFVSKLIPRFHFDCVPPVVIVAPRNLLDLYLRCIQSLIKVVAVKIQRTSIAQGDVRRRWQLIAEHFVLGGF